MLSTSNQIVNVLPLILKREMRPISTNEVNLLLEEEIPEIRKETGQIRKGLLAGVTDRHRKGIRVIPHMNVWKISDMNYYQYDCADK